MYYEVKVCLQNAVFNVSVLFPNNVNHTQRGNLKMLSNGV